MRDETRPMARRATADEQLEQLGRRIDVLAATMQVGTHESRTVIQRRVEVLRKSEASARAAAREAAASIEESVLELETRIRIAERAAAAEFTDDKNQFLVALMEELHSWDVHLERLQVKAAMTAGNGRSQAEDAIRELRSHRTGLGMCLAEMTSTSGEAWREVRQHVRDARHALESRAAEVEAALRKGARSDGHRLIA